MYKSIMSGEIPLFNQCPLDCLNLIMSYNETTTEEYKKDFDKVIHELQQLKNYCTLCGIDCSCHDNDFVNFFDETDVYRYDEENDILYEKIFNFPMFQEIYLKTEKRIKNEIEYIRNNAHHFLMSESDSDTDSDEEVENDDSDDDLA
jgi:hypothetical protein